MEIIYNGIISQSINKDCLLLTDVPEFVDMNNITFRLQYSDSFSGALFMSVNNYPFVTLENALNEVFQSLNYKSCLLTIGMNTVTYIHTYILYLNTEGTISIKILTIYKRRKK